MFSLFYQVLGNLGNRSVLISGSESTCREVFNHNIVSLIALSYLRHNEANHL